MKQTPSTFAQRYCLIISTVCLLSLMGIFTFVVTHADCLKDSAVASFLTGIVGAVIYILTSCSKFIVGSTAGSQAKDEATNATIADLSNKVANSTPIIPAITDVAEAIVPPSILADITTIIRKAIAAATDPTELAVIAKQYADELAKDSTLSDFFSSKQTQLTPAVDAEKTA